MMLSASLHMASCPVVAEACTNQIVEFQGNENSQEYNCRVFRKNNLIFFEHCSRLSANWYLIKNQLLPEKVAVLRERIFMSHRKTFTPGEEMDCISRHDRLLSHPINK